MSGSAIADIQDTYGAALIGLIVSTIFYGVTITQIWIYYCSSQNRSRDSMALKGFIAFLFITDTLHTVLCTYSVYWYLILNFGNVANLDVIMWAMNMQIEIISLIQILVQLFYARRFYILSKSIVVPVIIVLLSVICFALESVCFAKSFAVGRFSRYSSLIWVATAGMSLTAVTDTLIALAMCWFLYHNKTGISRTNSIVTTLIIYSITTGLVTSILAIGKMICFVTMSTKLIWVVFFWLMGKSYINAFLAILNNRDALRSRRFNHNSSNTFHISSSFRQDEPRSKSKTGQTAITFAAVHQTVTADSSRSTNDSDNEPGLDKPEGITIAPAHGRSQESIV